jgi:hypothetical protein
MDNEYIRDNLNMVNITKTIINVFKDIKLDKKIKYVSDVQNLVNILLKNDTYDYYKNHLRKKY